MLKRVVHQLQCLGITLAEYRRRRDYSRKWFASCLKPAVENPVRDQGAAGASLVGVVDLPRFLKIVRELEAHQLGRFTLEDAWRDPCVPEDGIGIPHRDALRHEVGAADAVRSVVGRPQVQVDGYAADKEPQGFDGRVDRQDGYDVDVGVSIPASTSRRPVRTIAITSGTSRSAATTRANTAACGGSSAAIRRR